MSHCCQHLGLHFVHILKFYATLNVRVMIVANLVEEFQGSLASGLLCGIVTKTTMKTLSIKQIKLRNLVVYQEEKHV